MTLKMNKKKSGWMTVYPKVKYDPRIADNGLGFEPKPGAPTACNPVPQDRCYLPAPADDPMAVERFASANDLAAPLRLVLGILREECPPGTEIATALDSDQNGEGDWIRVDVRLKDGREWGNLHDKVLTRRMNAPLDPRTDSLIRIVFE